MFSIGDYPSTDYNPHLNSGDSDYRKGNMHLGGAIDSDLEKLKAELAAAQQQLVEMEKLREEPPVCGVLAKAGALRERRPCRA